MSNALSRPQSPAGHFGANARGLLRLVYTHNPFYVISAWFVFTGLRVSFDPQGKLFDTTALLSSLAVYTVLLAGTACLLIRLGQVWEDVRSLLILIVLMFMAISVVIDDVLARHAGSGLACGVIGWLFALAVSEGLLRGMKISLPAGYRVPYYALLGLYFLYPASLVWWADTPAGPALQWGLFAFPTLAGLMLLTLLPAIWRGPAYVRRNGTPWSWPSFPLVLFGTLALGACLRSYYLCVSLHQVGGSGTIFGAYFLAPLLLCACLLLLEIGIVGRWRKVQELAMLLPAGVLLLVATNVKQGFVYERFEQIFVTALGGSPLFFTVLAVAGFYAWAGARRVPWAFEALSAATALFVVVGPGTNGEGGLTVPWGAPLLLVAALQLVLGAYCRQAARCLAGCVLIVAALTLNLQGTWFTAYYGALPLHLLLLSVLVLGAVFRDPLGRWLQQAGGMLLFGYCLGVVALSSTDSELAGMSLVYPLFAAALAVVFGYLGNYRLYFVLAAVCAAIGLAFGLLRGFEYLRTLVVGLDKIAWGLVFFLFAAGISLFKAGYFRRWPLRPPAEKGIAEA